MKGSVGFVEIGSRYPSDTEGLVIAHSCPHCGGGVLSGICVSCSREVCRHGQEKRMCVECSGKPLVLRYRVGRQ